MTRKSLALAATLTLALASAAHAGPADRSSSAVWMFATGAAVDGASSQLVRTDEGVSLSLRTRGLPAGDAVTVWWVIFNHPESCTADTVLWSFHRRSSSDSRANGSIETAACWNVRSRISRVR